MDELPRLCYLTGMREFFYVNFQPVGNIGIAIHSKSPGGQSLCRKSTSGWTVASVFYGAGRQSKATKIRVATVQSSVWTLQQILPDKRLPTSHF